jgi:hypothetical protein
MHQKPIKCGILLVYYTNDKVEWLAAGVLLIPRSIGLIKYADLEFANESSQWESKACFFDQ